MVFDARAGQSSVDIPDAIKQGPRAGVLGIDRIGNSKTPEDLRAITSPDEAHAYVIGLRNEYWMAKSGGRRIPRWESHVLLRQKLGADLRNDRGLSEDVVDWVVGAITKHLIILEGSLSPEIRESAAESFIRGRQNLLSSRTRPIIPRTEPV